VGDVDRAVRDLLGYGATQFRQIGLRPQGRFEKFLAAGSSDRMAILRDLFDVSLYRSLADKFAEDAKAADFEVSQGRELSVSTDGLTSRSLESDAIRRPTRSMKAWYRLSPSCLVSSSNGGW